MYRNHRTTLETGQLIVAAVIMLVWLVFLAKVIGELWHGQWLHAIRIFLLGNIGLGLAALVNGLHWALGAFGLLCVLAAAVHLL